jgi:hypothetical protein
MLQPASPVNDEAGRGTTEEAKAHLPHPWPVEEALPAERKEGEDAKLS